MREKVSIPISAIIAGKYANRLSAEDQNIGQLGESIRSVGLLCPLTVTPEGEGYLLMSGHRRLAACRMLGMREVECYVESRDDRTRREVVIAENSMRSDLTAIEDAEQIRRWIQEDGLGEEEVAGIYHRSVDWVRRQQALLSWPVDCLERIHTGEMSVAAAANLAQVTDDEYRKYLVKTAAENGGTARMTAAWLQGWRAMIPAAEAVEMEAEPSGYVPYSAPCEVPCLVCGTSRAPGELVSVLMCRGCLDSTARSHH